MSTLAELKKRKAALAAKAKGILEAAGDLTDEQRSQADSLTAELTTVAADIDRLEKLDEIARRADGTPLTERRACSVTRTRTPLGPR